MDPDDPDTQALTDLIYSTSLIRGSQRSARSFENRVVPCEGIARIINVNPSRWLTLLCSIRTRYAFVWCGAAGGYKLLRYSWPKASASRSKGCLIESEPDAAWVEAFATCSLER